MIDDSERLAATLAEWLKGRRYSEIEKRVLDLGSLRVLSDGRFVVQIRIDRGDFLLGIGCSPEAMEDEEQRYLNDFWALCLGLRFVDVDIPLDTVLSDEERLRIAEDDFLTAQKVLEKLQTLSESQLEGARACVRGRHENYWRARGLWPLPRPGSIMRLKNPEEREP